MVKPIKKIIKDGKKYMLFAYNGYTYIIDEKCSDIEIEERHFGSKWMIDNGYTATYRKLNEGDNLNDTYSNRSKSC